MALYMHQAARTPESWAAQLKNPKNRAEIVGNAAREAAGGKMIGAWYALGDWDLIIACDMPASRA